VATNLLGQNTPAIAAAETQYAEMWAQDATAMYAYASGSAAATRLTPFAAPPQTTDPAGVGAQAAAVGQAAGTSAAFSPRLLSQLISTLPTVLQAIATGATPATTADFLNFTSGWTFVASGVLFILGPLLEGPIAGLVPPLAAIGAYGPAAAGSGVAGLAGTGALATPALVDVGTPAGGGRPAVLAGLNRAGSIGGLSVPPAWAAPSMTRAAAFTEPALAGLPEAELDGLGPGPGGMLAGSLMAAAAGGGGAAGGGWAATRGSGAAKSGAAAQPGAGTAQPGTGTSAQFGPPARVIPQVDRDSGQATRPGQPAQAGDGPLSQNLRAEVNDLRKQVAEMAMERDLLMRSMALWARDSMGQ
jgi:PPE-repeat protein